VADSASTVPATAAELIGSWAADDLYPGYTRRLTFRADGTGSCYTAGPGEPTSDVPEKWKWAAPNSVPEHYRDELTPILQITDPDGTVKYDLVYVLTPEKLELAVWAGDTAPGTLIKVRDK
jgi:hypothetical protein